MSKEKRDFILFLEDIRQAVEKIESYSDNLTLEEFRTDSKTVDAIVRNFEVIGEASKSVPQNIRMLNGKKLQGSGMF